MAQYKVPQDVEAEDKLLGPFTFRQFIYLIIGFALLAAAWGLFQLMPLLCIIPLPIAAFFILLALPLRKDQPMEVYLAALVNFYLKPNHRLWIPGQRESVITITAPKQVEAPRARDISEEEAGHRLSFLSDLVDSEGMSIRNGTSMKDEYAAEANQVEDILDSNSNFALNQMMANEQNARHTELVSQMRTAISRAEGLEPEPAPQPAPVNNPTFNMPPQAMEQPMGQPMAQPMQQPMPSAPVAQMAEAQPVPTYTPQPIMQPAQMPNPTANNPMVQSQMQSLAQNSNFSIATLSQQANRVQQTQAQVQRQQEQAFQDFTQSQQNQYQAFQAQPQAQPMPQQQGTMMQSNNPNGLQKPVFTPDPNNPAVNPNAPIGNYQAFDNNMYDKFLEYQQQQANIPKKEVKTPPMLNAFEAKLEDNGRKVILNKVDEGPQISFHN